LGFLFYTFSLSAPNLNKTKKLKLETGFACVDFVCVAVWRGIWRSNKKFDDSTKSNKEQRTLARIFVTTYKR
jgi:hypothetical protein